MEKSEASRNTAALEPGRRCWFKKRIDPQSALPLLYPASDLPFEKQEIPRRLHDAIPAKCSLAEVRTIPRAHHFTTSTTPRSTIMAG